MTSPPHASTGITFPLAQLNAVILPGHVVILVIIEGRHSPSLQLGHIPRYKLNILTVCSDPLLDINNSHALTIVNTSG